MFFGYKAVLITEGGSTEVLLLRQAAKNVEQWKIVGSPGQWTIEKRSVRSLKMLFSKAKMSTETATPHEHKAVHKMLGNVWATFPISGNFFNFEQLLPL